MILFVLLLIALAAVVAVSYRFDDRRRGNYNNPSAYMSYRSIFLAWVLPILLVPYVLISVVVAGIQYSDAADITNSQYVIEQLEDQRAELASALEDNLTSEDFIRMMEAATPEDLAFLKNNPQVSEFMLGRADRIVGINTRLYAEQNKLLDQARGVCNYTDNPLIPKIPFIGPDCTLGKLESQYKVNESQGG